MRSQLRFDRRSLDLLVAPDGFVGLRDHANQLVLSACAGEYAGSARPISPVPMKTIRMPPYGIKLWGATARRARREAAARAIILSPAVTSR